MGAAPSIQQGGAQASKPWARPQTPPRTDWLGLPELPGVCFCADGRDGKGFAIRQDHTGAPAAFPGAKAFTTPAAVPSLDLAHVMQGSASGGRATTLSLDAQDKLTNLHVLPRPAADSLPPLSPPCLVARLQRGWPRPLSTSGQFNRNRSITFDAAFASCPAGFVE